MTSPRLQLWVVLIRFAETVMSTTSLSWKSAIVHLVDSNPAESGAGPATALILRSLEPPSQCSEQSRPMRDDRDDAQVPRRSVDRRRAFPMAGSGCTRSTSDSRLRPPQTSDGVFIPVYTVGISTDSSTVSSLLSRHTIINAPG